MRSLAKLASCIALFIASSAHGIDPVYAVRLAIDGYDPVAYFTDAKPVRGTPQFEYAWKGAKWFFASAAHRDAFKNEPEKYAPQYGGYCAYAVAINNTAKIDPFAWKVVGDKLYLNFNKKIKAKWEQEQAAYIAKADANWPKLLKKIPGKRAN